MRDPPSSTKFCLTVPAEVLDLRTKLRERPDGRITGAGVFDRGHIHRILTNPIYAGRIRHKEQVFDGQHTAIIDPEIWNQVQQMLIEGSTKAKGTKQKAKRSPLAGKLFDETGDRLTPSHSKKKRQTPCAGEAQSAKLAPSNNTNYLPLPPED